MRNKGKAGHILQGKHVMTSLLLSKYCLPCLIFHLSLFIIYLIINITINFCFEVTLSNNDYLISYVIDF